MSIRPQQLPIYLNRAKQIKGKRQSNSRLGFVWNVFAYIVPYCRTTWIIYQKNYFLFSNRINIYIEYIKSMHSAQVPVVTWLNEFGSWITQHLIQTYH